MVPYSLSIISINSIRQFVQNLIKIKIAKAFNNLTLMYINDVMSVNNANFANCIPLKYTPDIEINETTETASSDLFLDFYLKCDTDV